MMSDRTTRRVAVHTPVAATAATNNTDVAHIVKLTELVLRGNSLVFAEGGLWAGYKRVDALLEN